MADTLSTTEIKQRTIKGAKWLILMNGMGIPAAFLIALLLGRAGPAALGYYALAQVLIGFITTFVIYGGAPVLTVFMPKITRAGDRGRFLFTYGLILGVMMVLVLAVLGMLPSVFTFLLQRDFDMRNYGWFVLLSLVIVLSETLANAANGLMLIKVTAIARQMMRTILLPLVVILFFWKREILVAFGMPCILGGFFAGYLVSAVLCAYGLSRERRFSMVMGWFLPPGFWSFSITTMLATIFTFLYGNFDRMAVLTIQDVRGLGKYQAVLSLSMLIGIIPQMLSSTLVPMFASLLATEKIDAVHKAYELLQRIGSLMMTGAALVLISYSRELLSLFGDSYSSYDYLLSLFSIQYVVTSLHFGNTPILTAYEKNAFRLSVSTLQILIQIIGTILFIKSFGVLAIAGAKIVGVVSSNILSIVYVSKYLGDGFTVPSSYKMGVVITLLCAALRNGFLPDGWLISTGVFLFFILSYMLVARITLEEIRGIVNLVLSRKATS
jgi:O-antigen/teichoic acid export membrane protein